MWLVSGFGVIGLEFRVLFVLFGCSVFVVFVGFRFLKVYKVIF